MGRRRVLKPRNRANESKRPRKLMGRKTDRCPNVPRPHAYCVARKPVVLQNYAPSSAEHASPCSDHEGGAYLYTAS